MPTVIAFWMNEFAFVSLLGDWFQNTEMSGIVDADAWHISYMIKRSPRNASPHANRTKQMNYLTYEKYIPI